MVRQKITKFLNKIHTPPWVVGVLGGVFLLRIPSFFEPFSYGDEMIYLSLGEAVRRGLTLYKDIHDNKPPLLYFLAAIAGNVFWFRVILAFWMMATVVIFWKLTQALFPASRQGGPKKTKVQKVAVGAFAILTTIPLFEGQIANAEVFMVGPTILAFLILLAGKDRLANIFLAGVLFAVAALFKIPAALDAPVIVLLWLITSKDVKKSFAKITRKTIFLSLGFALPIALSLAWYYSKGALNNYLTAAFGQNIGYLSSFRPQDTKAPFLQRNGPLLIRSGIVGLGLLLLFYWRKKLSPTFIFASLWLLFSLFAVTLSERPYPHYLIQIVPSISLLIAIFVGYKNIEQTLVIIPLTLAALVLVYFKFWYYPTIPYYARFLEFASGKITKQEYFARFDGNVNRNYEISKLIAASTTPDDKVFVWGDSPPIYALARRLPPIKYLAGYHIHDFSSPEEVVGILEEQNPRVIVILPESPSFPKLQPLLDSKYLFIATVEDAKIWRLANSNPPQ